MAACREVVVQRLRQDQPGQLDALADKMAQAGVNIEVLYSDHDNQLIIVPDNFERASRVSQAWAASTAVPGSNGSNRALLVIDAQVGVLAGAWQRESVVRRIALAVERARQAGVPVVWVQHHDDELKHGTPPWQLVPELVPLEAEVRIDKAFNSAFERTDLLAMLNQKRVSRLFLAGAATNWCIRATAYGALDRGFDVTLISDAHTTEEMTLESGRVVEARAVIDDLNTVMRWVSYPDRRSTVAAAADADFADGTRVSVPPS